MAKLKEATKHQHDELESVVNVMDQMFTTSDYVELLSKFHGFYSAIEQQLAAFDLSEFGIDVGERLKVQLLTDDLAHFGAKLPNDVGRHKTPRIDSQATALGAMYVLEGATLGGQVISRHLKQHLGLDADGGAAFFNSYGDRVGPMWKAFCAAATTFSDNHAGQKDTEIIETARATFDSFGKWFATAEAAAN